MDETSGMTVGLYAGSFDPPHLGHLSIVARAASWCDTLYVVVAGNPSKRDGLFTRAERRELLAASTEHLPGVETLEHGGLTIELANRLGADVLIRSIGKEQASELEMAVANRLAGGPLTIFLAPMSETASLSSSHVRAAFAAGGAASVERLVPPAVTAALRAREPAAIDR